MHKRGEVNVMFKKPMHKIVDRIKNKPYFRWPNKIGVTHQEEIRIYTTLIIGIRGIPSNNAGC